MMRKPALEQWYAKLLMVMVSLFLVVTMLPAVSWAAAPSSNIGWYTANPSAVSFTLNTIEDIAGFSELVNGTASDGGDAIPAQSFEGKTVKLGSNDINGRSLDITPIGGQNGTSFKGTFDGNGKKLDNFTIVSTSDSNIGLFGHAGSGSLIKNVMLGNAVSITKSYSEADDPFIESVGLLVGYSEGSLENCSAAGSITLNSAVTQKSKDFKYVIEKVGGLAGVCYGDIDSCSFSGSIYVEASSAPLSELDTPELINYVGGIVGLAGDAAAIGEVSTLSSHGTISDCKNYGSIRIETPSLAGTDRFGEQIVAQSMQVGGIAGYSRGSIYTSENHGYLRAENATRIGGIVGSFRSAEAEGNANYSSEGRDDGSELDEITVSECVNYDIIYGRAAIGGIVGQAGTYTVIESCINQDGSMVVGTRWNKPAPGGIAGRSYGIIRYCGNLGRIASATWDNEANRTLILKSGYYCAGIAGMLLFYTEKNPNTGVQDRSSPLPEVYNCYNAGAIEVQSGFRSRNIVGDNYGYVHDNVALTGMCDQDVCVYGEVASEVDATGSCNNNVVCTKIASNAQSAENSLKGNGIMIYKKRILDSQGKEAWEERSDFASVFEFLNSLADGNNWATYWVKSQDSLNAGYPVLKWQADEAGWSKTDLSGASLSLASGGNAKYTGGLAIPQVTARLGSTNLIQNVDYKVIPDPTGINVTPGTTPYATRIEGIGSYTGTSTATVAYGIDKGSLTSCSVVIDSKAFNWQLQTPDTVSVKDSFGNIVEPGEYSYELQGEARNAGVYDVVVTADPLSPNFEGTTTGVFRIEAARIMSDVNMEENGSQISYLGETWDWYSGQNSITAPDESRIPVLAYTGYSIQPQVINVSYLGEPMVEGRDYRVVYGDLGGDTDDQGAIIKVSEDNIGSLNEREYGAITVRYVGGSNFSNYDNMVFYIDGNTEKLDLVKATVDAPDLVFEGLELRPVKLNYGNAVLVEGVDYAISYVDNFNVGTASYTIVGKGRFTGTLTGTFEISNDPRFTFTYTTSGPNATITGFSYHGIFPSFDLSIPTSLDDGGNSYTVTAIGNNAFGGTTAAHFQDNDKLKINSVTIPATVTSLGEYAFGSGGTAYEPIISSVVFEEGSQLVTIGKGAFSRCKNLKQFTFPEGVTTIGDSVFSYCSNLTSLIFDTQSSTLPSSVASNSFTGLGAAGKKVTVLGANGATRVKKLATDNATSGPIAGANGGLNFSFQTFLAYISDANAEAIDAQIYSGEAITPEISLSYGGSPLTKGTDYTVVGSDNVNAGTATLIVAGLGGYAGFHSLPFTILPYDLGSSSAITLGSVFDQSYTGNEVTPYVSVKFKGSELVLDKDYTLSYSNNTAEGTATAHVSGIGNFGGTAHVQFKIVKRSEHTVAGENRVLTALEGAKLAYPNGCDGVVVTRSSNFPDALAASTLAGRLDYPIILSDTGQLDATVTQAIRDFGAKEAIILGDENSVSAAVSDTLASIVGSKNVTRIGGSNRVETQEKIYEYGKKLDLWGGRPIIATANSFADALSIAAYASTTGSPIFIVDGASPLSANNQAALISDYKDTSAIIVGGVNTVSVAVEDWLAVNLGEAPQRLAGNVGNNYGDNRYGTAAAISCFCIDEGMEIGNVGFATGQDYPDALSGGPVQAKAGSFIVLAVDSPGGLTAVEAIRDKIGGPKDTGAIRFYGKETGWISTKLRNDIKTTLWGSF